MTYRDVLFKEFEEVRNNYNDRIVKRCCICGNLDYLSASNPKYPWYHIAEDLRDVCAACGDVRSRFITQAEADYIDEMEGIDDTDRYIYPEEQIYPSRYTCTWDEWIRCVNVYKEYLKEYLLEYDKETYDKFRDYFENSIEG